MKTLVVFGSVTDGDVYKDAVKRLEENGITAKLQVLSAHRTPAEVEELPFDSYDAIIAGAGLAAHLPGVIAARTIRPVFGIPCKGAFEGLDAWLSIVQMPPGTPVLCTPVGGSKDAVSTIASMRNGKPIHLKASKTSKALIKAEEWLKGANIPFTKGDNVVEDAFTILFCNFEDSIPDEPTNIICPIADTSTAQDALKFFSKAKGVWVGLNRGENAAIAAAQLAGVYSKELIEHKKSQRAFVLEVRNG